MTLNVLIFLPQSPEAWPIDMHHHSVYAMLELELTVLHMLEEHSTSSSTPQEIYCLLKARHSKILSVFTPMTALLKINNTVFICRSHNSLHRIMFQQSFTESFGFPKPLVFTWTLLVFSEALKTEQAKNIKINEPCIFFPDND